MPTSTRHARTLSPPQSLESYSNPPTSSPARVNVNVVNRLAIEGKCRRGLDGASIRMYLKISLPVDNLTPGTPIPLFPEENMKIQEAQVHPLDKNSAPYSFSSTTSPLLHKAARALNFPARLPHSYLTLFDSSSASTSSASSSAPLEEKYTGHIIVSGYNVTYILPKEFPRRDNDSFSRQGTNTMMFMAVIDLWVPFLTQPPYAPYLLSIPVPRCLSNNIRLSIFPPKPMSSSYASLSSAGEDEGGPWELTSDPHVTRTATSWRGRSSSYTSYADDESSDSSVSAGFADGCGIQGTFQSTDRVRIRWAIPGKAGQALETGDGRRHVGVREVKGELTCEVLGKGKAPEHPADGVLMKLEYKAACKGVWFPGVATLLGMDVSLDAGDCEIAWAPGEPQEWSVTGKRGFTGFAVAGLPQGISGNQMPPMYVLPSTPNGVPTANGATSRQDSLASTHSVSLLRSPLPNQNVPEYSFEGTPLSTPTGTVSSLASFSASTPDHRRSRAGSMKNPFLDADPEPEPEVAVRPPQAPLTVHINMNELLPPNRDPFKFSISGTILVIPRSGPSPLEPRRPAPKQRISSDSDSSPESVPVPMFRVSYKDREINTATIINSAQRGSLEVFTLASDDGRTHRTMLQRGDRSNCGTDSVRVVIRPPPPVVPPLPIPSPPLRALHGMGSRELSVTSEDTPVTRPRIPSGLRSYLETPSDMRHTSMSMMSTAHPLPRRDGPLMIPYVTANVTPLLTGEDAITGFAYAVHLSFPAPSDSDSEWLQFGLERPATTATTDGWEPEVQIANASVEGVPVRFLTNLSTESASIKDLAGSLEGMSRRKWFTWIQVHVGDFGAGRVHITYIISPKQETKTEKAIGQKDEKNKSAIGKQRAKDILSMDILLPCFTLPVGQLDVFLKLQQDYAISDLQTNLLQEETSSTACKLIKFALLEVQESWLRIRIARRRTSRTFSAATPLLWRLLQVAAVLLPIILLSYLTYELRSRNAELQNLRASLASLSAELYTGQPVTDPETVTLTSTITTTAAQKWWYTADSVLTTQADSTSADASDGFRAEESTPTILTTVTMPPVIPPNPPKRDDRAKEQALLPVQQLQFAWPLRLDLPGLTNVDIAQTARASAEVVVKGLEIAWKIFQKVMYYPLDPP